MSAHNVHSNHDEPPTLMSLNTRFFGVQRSQIKLRENIHPSYTMHWPNVVPITDQFIRIDQHQLRIMGLFLNKYKKLSQYYFDVRPMPCEFFVNPLSFTCKCDNSLFQFVFINRSNHCYWEQNECLNIKICKCFVSI